MLPWSPLWASAGEHSTSESPTLGRLPPLITSGCFHPLVDEPGLKRASLLDRRGVFRMRRSKEQAGGLSGAAG